MSSQEIFALRRSGQSAQALAMARENYAQYTQDVWFVRAYGWALYDHIKNIIDGFEHKRVSIGALNAQLKPLLMEFANIANPLRGDTVFSSVLRLVGKVSADWDEFLLFAKWAGLQDFTDDDKRPFITDDGNKIDSLEKRFARAICKQTAVYAANPNADRELLEWGKRVLDGELLKTPNDQWLNYYHCKIYLANGQYTEALDTFGPVLRRQSRAAWAWALLAEILENSRQQEAITCFIYATQLAREEQEVAKVRIKLASLLAVNQRFGEAAYQANLALQYRQNHNYKVPEELAQLISSDWYQQALTANALTQSQKAEQAAKQILLELERKNLTYVLGVVENINKQKGLTYIATGVDSGLPLFHKQHTGSAKLKEGTIVELGLVEKDKVLDFKLATVNKIDGFCEMFQGEYDHQEGNSFAFINSGSTAIFVPPYLAESFKPQANQVSCLAAKRKNKQGKIGWRALTISA